MKVAKAINIKIEKRPLHIRMWQWITPPTLRKTHLWYFILSYVVLVHDESVLECFGDI